MKKKSAVILLIGVVMMSVALIAGYAVSIHRMDPALDDLNESSNNLLISTSETNLILEGLQIKEWVMGDGLYINVFDFNKNGEKQQKILCTILIVDEGLVYTDIEYSNSYNETVGIFLDREDKVCSVLFRNKDDFDDADMYSCDKSKYCRNTGISNDKLCKKVEKEILPYWEERIQWRARTERALARAQNPKNHIEVPLETMSLGRDMFEISEEIEISCGRHRVRGGRFVVDQSDEELASCYYQNDKNDTSIINYRNGLNEWVEIYFNKKNDLSRVRYSLSKEYICHGLKSSVKQLFSRELREVCEEGEKSLKFWHDVIKWDKRLEKKEKELKAAEEQKERVKEAKRKQRKDPLERLDLKVQF